MKDEDLANAIKQKQALDQWIEKRINNTIKKMRGE
jgi:predicted HicB family RNase H-like nuclease